LLLELRVLQQSHPQSCELLHHEDGSRVGQLLQDGSSIQRSADLPQGVLLLLLLSSSSG
jgi:hypothetical protein